MIEKKYKKFINEMSYYKTLLKPQYKQYFDVIASLYIDRKIEKKTQVEKILKKLIGRGTAAQSGIKLINKYKDYKSVKGIIKGSKPRTYHIEGKIKCRISYEGKVYIETFIESKKLYALTQQQATSEYGDELESKYNFITSHYESEVLTIKFRIMAVEEPEKSKTKHKYKLEDMKMKKCRGSKTILNEVLKTTLDDLPYKDNDKGLCELCGINKSTCESFAYFCDTCYKLKAVKTAEKKHFKEDDIINYDYVDEHKDFNDEGVSNQCVINNFIGMYPELNLSRHELITLCERFYNPSSGLDDNDDEIKWTIEDGVSPKCINKLCQKFDITHYAHDAQQKCFMKHVSRNRNHKALVYYAIDNHMYLIKDKSLVKSLS